MTPETEEKILRQLTIFEELVKYLATKEELQSVRAEMHKEFGNFKTDITKALWLSQLSMAGIIVVLVGIINSATFFCINQH